LKTVLFVTSQIIL